jgi:diketogulonate reductase-like aldo/keto reductase
MNIFIYRLTALAVERGHSVLAKSVTASRIKANGQITKLDSKDMQEFAELSSKDLWRDTCTRSGKSILGFPISNRGSL